MAIQITVKDIDEKTFRELKSYAIQNKVTVGRALTLAMHTFITHTHKPKRKLSSIKPFAGGPDTTHLSEQIDEVLYA